MYRIIFHISLVEAGEKRFHRLRDRQTHTNIQAFSCTHRFVAAEKKAVIIVLTIKKNCRINFHFFFNPTPDGRRENSFQQNMFFCSLLITTAPIACLMRCGSRRKRISGTRINTDSCKENKAIKNKKRNEQ